MIRQIIHIDQEKCNGCGLCVKACHEGAIALIGGKAYLAREHYCDGLGDCLPGCPTGAITFETREAPAYDEAAVLKAKAEKAAAQGGCPGSRMRTLSPEPEMPQGGHCPSQLRQWPVQLKLVPVQAPWFDGADVLVAADCTAYAYGDFHRDFLRGKCGGESLLQPGQAGEPGRICHHAGQNAEHPRGRGTDRRGVYRRNP